MRSGELVGIRRDELVTLMQRARTAASVQHLGTLALRAFTELANAAELAEFVLRCAGEPLAQNVDGAGCIGNPIPERKWRELYDAIPADRE